MSKIIAVEDDSGTRMLIVALLKKDGHEVLEAADGLAGLQLVLEHKPDLVVSDVEMPVMSGLDMLGHLRSNPDVADTAVILLTSLEGRTAMRTGMTRGADDYITKPFRPMELREAVAAQLQRSATRQTLQTFATQQALDTQQLALDEMYMAQYGSQFAPDRLSPDAARDERFGNATLLGLQITSYAQLAAKLSNVELTDVLKRFYASASDSINLFHAHHVEFEGSGMLALFAAKDDSDTVSHSLRACKAALGVMDATKAANAAMRQHFGGRDVGDLVVNVALDCGPVALTVVNDSLGSGRDYRVLVGEVVAMVKALQTPFAQRRWGVGATVQVLSSLGGQVRVTDRTMVAAAAGQRPVDCGEIIALAR